MKFRPLFNPTQMQFQLTIGDWEPSKGIQKISGFTRGLKFHKVDYFPYWHISNSIVLGYNRDSKTSPIRLFMYAYVKGKQVSKIIGEYMPNTKFKSELRWTNKRGLRIELEHENLSFAGGAYLPIYHKTLPIGFQLFPYYEIDGTNKKKPFEVEITDIKIS